MYLVCLILQAKKKRTEVRLSGSGAVKAGQAFVNLTMVGRDAVVVTRDGFGLAVGRLSRPDEQLGEVEWERLVSGMRALVCGSGLRP